MSQSDSGLDELFESLAHEWSDEMKGSFEQAQEDVTKQG
jgi:hypothetical protein